MSKAITAVDRALVTEKQKYVQGEYFLLNNMKYLLMTYGKMVQSFQYNLIQPDSLTLTVCLKTMFVTGLQR